MAELPEPLTAEVYRGFIVSLPEEISTSGLLSVEYQYRSSTDNSFWTGWSELAIVTQASHFRFIHDSLYTTVYYQYKYKTTRITGEVSDWSDYITAGNGGRFPLDEPIDEIEQLAGSLGTITSGYLRGVVFETNKNYPKVRMDPNGFYAINNSSTPVYINAYTGEATFTGTVTGSYVVGGDILGAVIQTATPDNPRVKLQEDTIEIYDAFNLVLSISPYYFQTFDSLSGDLTFHQDYEFGLIDFRGEGYTDQVGAINFYRNGTSTHQRGIMMSATESSNNVVAVQSWGDDALDSSHCDIIAAPDGGISGFNFAGVGVQQDNTAGSAKRAVYIRTGTDGGSDQVTTLMRSDGYTSMVLNNSSWTRPGFWATLSISSWNIAPGTASFADLVFSNNLPTNWLVVMHQINTAFMDLCSWAITTLSANSIRINMYCDESAGGNAQGDSYGLVITSDLSF